MGKITTVVGAALAALPATAPLVVLVVDEWAAAAAVTTKESIALITKVEDLFVWWPPTKHLSCSC
jgi:hypothetical protein